MTKWFEDAIAAQAKLAATSPEVAAAIAQYEAECAEDERLERTADAEAEEEELH